MKTLHILTQANIPDGLDCALATHDAVTLLAEGVYQVASKHDLEKLADLGVSVTYVLAEDLKIRGIETKSSEIITISYKDLARIVFEYDRNITW